MNMKKKIVLAIFLSFVFCNIAGAASVNCDMEYYIGETYWGTDTYLHYVGTAADPNNTGTYWNSLIAGDVDNNVWVYPDLIASDGYTVTPIRFELTDPSPVPSNLGAYSGGLISGTPVVGNNLLHDYWYNLNTVDDILISGLRPGKEYTLYCYKDQNIGGFPTTWNFPGADPNTATAIGASGAIPPGEWTEGEDHVIFTVTADVNGEVAGEFTNDTTEGEQRYTEFNGLQIVWDDDMDINVGDGLSVSENGPTSDSYSFALTWAPTANVVVTIIPDAQITVDPCSLTFTSGDWNTPQPVTVTAVDDAAIEGAHQGIVSYSVVSTDPAFENVVAMATPVQIEDNEGGPVPSGLVEVDEAAPSASAVPYTVVLSAAPTSNVDVTVAPDAQVTIDSDPCTAGNQSVLTFTSTNWDVPQEVYVSVVDDEDSEGFPGVDRNGNGIGPLGVQLIEAGWHTSTILHTCSSSDLGFDGSSNTHTVYVMDNEEYCRDGVNHSWLETDVNFDCYVDMEDFAIIGQNWSQCTDPKPGSGCVPFP